MGGWFLCCFSVFFVSVFSEGFCEIWGVFGGGRFCVFFFSFLCLFFFCFFSFLCLFFSFRFCVCFNSKIHRVQGPGGNSL